MNSTPRCRLLAAATLSLAVGVPALCASVAPKPLPKTKLVSVHPKGRLPAQSPASWAPSVSADGRYVTYLGDATGRPRNDTNDRPDVYYRDLKRSKASLVSVAAGTSSSGDQGSFAAVISGNGRFVVFTSAATNLVAGDDDGAADAFVRDMKLGTTALVSALPNGKPAGADAALAISDDGNLVAFGSSANGVVPQDANGTADVFLRNVSTGTTTLVSVNGAGTGPGAGFAYLESMTPDGRFIAFRSGATDMGATDGNAAIDVVVRDVVAGTSHVVSVDTSGTRTGDAASVKPRLTPDGRFVAFESDAGDLVAVDGNGMRDVFVRDLVGGTTVLVSHTLAGPGGGAATSYLGSISADGRFVGFDTTSADIVAGDGNGAADVFLADLQGNPTRLVSVNRLGTGPGNGASSSPVVSPDGRWVVFRSDASDLVPRDTNGTSDLFVRDMLTGTTRLVSSTTNGKDSGNAYSSEPVLAADGKTLVFSSDATNLVPGDHNFAGDVFVRSIR